MNTIVLVSASKTKSSRRFEDYISRAELRVKNARALSPYTILHKWIQRARLFIFHTLFDLRYGNLHSKIEYAPHTHNTHTQTCPRGLREALYIAVTWVLSLSGSITHGAFPETVVKRAGDKEGGRKRKRESICMSE